MSACRTRGPGADMSKARQEGGSRRLSPHKKSNQQRDLLLVGEEIFDPLAASPTKVERGRHLRQ